MIDFYEHHLTIEPGCTMHHVYRPMYSGTAWQFFFDDGARSLDLISIKVGHEEQLEQPVFALLFVFALPHVVLPRVNIGVGAEIALRNPTPKPVEFTMWIGAYSSLVRELRRRL